MENIRIQDDLYNYVNQQKLEELVIPADKPMAGGFAELADSVEKIMMGEFEEMSQTKAYPNDFMRRACELYAIAKDADKKAKDGIAPALKMLAKLDEIHNMDDLSRLFASLSVKSMPLPFRIGVLTDMKNS